MGRLGIAQRAELQSIKATYNDTVPGEGFFGWVCNAIALYPYAQPRAADVVLQGGGLRPKVVLHRNDSEDDPLVIDQTNGIALARAQALAERALHETWPLAQADPPQ